MTKYLLFPPQTTSKRNNGYKDVPTISKLIALFKSKWKCMINVSNEEEMEVGSKSYEAGFTFMLLFIQENYRWNYGLTQKPVSLGNIDRARDVDWPISFIKII